MIHENAKWIWLDSNHYPEFQRNQQQIIWPKTGKDCVVDFFKEMEFAKIPQKITLHVSADAVFRLWMNEAFVGQGPASAGGDFLLTGPIPWYYANEYVVYPKEQRIHFFAQVRLQPQEMSDITGGHGGFYLWGNAEFADGTAETFGSDATWKARINPAFVKPYVYDETQKTYEWEGAVVSDDQRSLEVAPIPPLSYDVVYPKEDEQRRISLCVGETAEIDFDRIYSAHIGFHCDGACHLKISCYEMLGLGVSCEEVHLTEASMYRSFYMKSISRMDISVLDAKGEVCIEPYLYFSHYPVMEEGHMKTSDQELDLLYEVCKWTLKICRQTLHLDSPKHQELLACSGDYYIESMMTAFTFGDMRLASLDVRRTAKWLAHYDGRMFHTTYSLIWVQWLEFVFQFTGETALLEDCHEALVKLLERFDSYRGEKGILENPPDYMFVDWTVLEGYSMHHPPKCLGQTVLNAFYYKALTDAVIIAKRQDWQEALLWQKRAEDLHQAFHSCFYDEEKNMYVDGLSDETIESEWQPKNVEMRHFSRYANTLAVLYDLCPEKERVRLTRLVVEENELPPVQPYFMHFILQTVCKVGLVKDYGLTLFEKWKPLVKTCSKGLQEGWIAPEPGYSFDHSHAWGGTPAYHMPYLLLGFQMLEPGFKKIAFSPQLWGLDYADITFPTPYGMFRCVQRKGEEAKIFAPDNFTMFFSDDVLYYLPELEVGVET